MQRFSNIKNEILSTINALIRKFALFIIKKKYQTDKKILIDLYYTLNYNYIKITRKNS